MTGRLTSLTVENFRSIRGSQRISLDAPVVLIHGPNGTGKTSLLSAIEFGLTGAVGSFGRFDPDYIRHLPHKLSPNGSGRVVVEVENLGSAECLVDGRTVTGRGLLSVDPARFFTERSYLPQAALGRLLEIYEHQDTRRTDSPLTRFVKDLLGLEALDALIEGLHASGDVRRLREPAPDFWAARAVAPQLTAAVVDARKRLEEAETTVAAIEAELRTKSDALQNPEAAVASDGTPPDLEALADETERRLEALARRRRDLAAATDQLTSLSVADATAERLGAEAAAGGAAAAVEAWSQNDGGRLIALFDLMRDRFPGIPAGASDPELTHGAATRLVETELQRLQSLLQADDADSRASTEVEETLRQGRARLSTIDGELQADTGANKQLAAALTALSGHIHDEICPVCGRDFTEVSGVPLAAHVSEEVQNLIETAGRVEALVRDRTNTASALTLGQRRQAELQARVLPDERRDVLKTDVAQFSEWRTALVDLAGAAAEGARLQREALDTARSLSTLTTRQTGLVGLRAELVEHARALDRPLPGDGVTLQAALADLMQFVVAAENAGQSLLNELEEIGDLADDLGTAGAEVIEARTALEQATVADTTASGQRAEAERTIAAVKELAQRAQALRTDKVRQVFNDELNSVWRELFIRLAPEEQFVPAFALPPNSHGPVEAVLETIYRSGGKGGNPRAMLSAGNLNTAALTLFLALNLSVKPMLPWLIIDDPVQSMDDVHIAQFAALLRSLKREGRQVILAVHDRQLFEYLALELSPTVNGDRLITVELGRSADGMTTASWTPTVYEPDKAVA